MIEVEVGGGCLSTKVEKRRFSLVFLFVCSVCMSAFAEKMHKNYIAVSFLFSWNLILTGDDFCIGFCTHCSLHTSPLCNILSTDKAAGVASCSG